MVKLNMDVSEFLEQKRAEQGITKAWLAEQMGTSRMTLATKFRANKWRFDDIMVLSTLLHFDLNNLKKSVVKVEINVSKLGKIKLI